MRAEEWIEEKDFYATAGRNVLAWLEAVDERRRRARGGPNWVIESRLKDWNSIEGKIERKKARRPGYSVSDMTDLFGIRVIVESSASAWELARLFVEKPPFVVKEVENFIHQARPDGYRGIHIILLVDVRLPSNTGVAMRGGVPVELQIRTMLQHQWSQLSHSEFYKSVAEIPEGLLARMRALSEILECAEIESDQLRRGRVLDSGTRRIRRVLRERVLEGLGDAGEDGRKIGLQALQLLEAETQLRRALVSDTEKQVRGFEALVSVVGSLEAYGVASEGVAECRAVVEEARAIVRPLGSVNRKG